MALDAALLELTARELKQRLADARIDKIFEPTRDEVVLHLRTRTVCWCLRAAALPACALRRRHLKTRLRRPRSACCCVSIFPAAGLWTSV